LLRLQFQEYLLLSFSNTYASVTIFYSLFNLPYIKKIDIKNTLGLNLRKKSFINYFIKPGYGLTEQRVIWNHNKLWYVIELCGIFFQPKHWTKRVVWHIHLHNTCTEHSIFLWAVRSLKLRSVIVCFWKIDINENFVCRFFQGRKDHSVTSGFQEGPSCLDLRQLTEDTFSDEKVREIYVRRVSCQSNTSSNDKPVKQDYTGPFSNYR